MAFTPYQSPISKYLNSVQPYPKPVSMQGPKPVSSWANTSQSGTAINTQPWDPNNMFSSAGMTSTTPAKQTIQMSPFVAPQMETFQPANSTDHISMDPMSTPQMETVGGPVASGGNAPSNQSPNFNFTMDDLIKYMGQTDMPTMDQITMDPSYQFQQQQGINAIDSSAAARGGLLSSGHTKDIQDYAQGLASQEYGKAYDRFRNNRLDKANRLSDAFGMLDANRKYGAGRYDTGVQQDQIQQGLDQNAYEYGNNFGYKTFFDMMNDYGTRMSAANKNDSSLAGTGFTSAKEASDLVTNSASALANIGMSQAQIAALSKQAASGQNTDMIKTFISTLPALLALL